MRKMSVQHTNYNTSQDKGQTGQEVNNQELIKKNSPDNRLASILLAVAFYLAIVYLALFLLLGLSNPWGIVIMIFLAPNLISFIIATILTRIGRKKGNKNFLYTSVIFYLVSYFYVVISISKGQVHFETTTTSPNQKTPPS